MTWSALSHTPDDWLDAALRRGLVWLNDHFIDDGPHAGWPHFGGESMPTVWGGTLDAVRAQVSCGTPALDPRMARAVAWLKSQQRADGGFGTREMDYSAVEATAWVVITLSELGVRAEADPAMAAAILYIKSCVSSKGSVSTTPADAADPRTMPAALALWALASQGTETLTVNAIVEGLRATQDPSIHGWGVSLGAQPNPANTGQVLVALRAAGMSTDATWIQAARDYLLRTQLEDGSWPNSFDEWFTDATPHVPYRCSNFGQTWGAVAMSWFSDESARRSAERGIRRLVDKQRESGAWQFDEFDPREHVWCTSQAMWAMSSWMRSAGRAHLPGWLRSITGAAARTVAWLRGSLLYLVVAGLVIWQFTPTISEALEWLGMTFSLDLQGIWTNLLSSIIWGGLTILTAALVRRATRRRL